MSVRDDELEGRRPVQRFAPNLERDRQLAHRRDCGHHSHHLRYAHFTRPHRPAWGGHLRVFPELVVGSQMGVKRSQIVM
ncbi:hypothetical protein Pflav_018010 [Phytohabitans flavus]|uniref:Uncharacterized protein n=1 Tax=Phytohabitans flavus TaxID=1076124 RepID=A0A6F8XNR2_9ACTN|nr:hypothetical protein Pflav_018010 [Phytohabitans flavus]